MRLPDYLKKHGIKRSDFAQRIGVAPAVVTVLCKPDAWPSSVQRARDIARETGGEVMPNDFLQAPADEPEGQPEGDENVGC